MIVTITSVDERYARVVEGKATPDDIRRASRGFWEKLKGAFQRIPFARDAVALYHFITDEKADWSKRGPAALALLYFISPLDFIPDALPGVGFIDDAFVIAAAIKLLTGVLAQYHDRADDWLARGAEPEPEVVRDIEIVQH